MREGLAVMPGQVGDDIGGDILSASEVADMLDMDVQMVRSYARKGRLPAYRLPGGRKFKFFRDEVLDYVRQFPAKEDE